MTKPYEATNGWTKQLMLNHLAGMQSDQATEYGTCVYFVEDEITGKVKRCAVGMFIPAGHDALRDFSGTASSLFSQFPELLGFMPLNAKGMDALQKVHDNSNTVAEGVRIAPEEAPARAACLAWVKLYVVDPTELGTEAEADDLATDSGS